MKVMLDKWLTLQDVVAACDKTDCGKKLPRAFYIHTSAICELPSELQTLILEAQTILAQNKLNQYPYNLIKIHFDKFGLSFLNYPGFETNPHPPLATSLFIEIQRQRVQYQDYRSRQNPPILHRKETFLASSHPQYQLFAELTQQQESLGLLKESRGIGTQQAWTRKLAHHKVEIIEHRLSCPLHRALSNFDAAKIERHRAALVRQEL